MWKCGSGQRLSDDQSGEVERDEGQYKHYQRLVFIHSGVGDREHYSRYVRDVAQFIKVPCAEQEGSLRLLTKLVRGEWDQEFVVVPPGRMVMQRQVFNKKVLGGKAQWQTVLKRWLKV